ncbi:flagellar motor switch protein FliN [Buchnera aphidicola (Thelaxes californica)]|uniref:Flagellar motor switch protein FliN n=1 Tax=Buchnera aphidicola (Thelaxes californica) TaxID=1315998 RepID=A0A4D6YJG9_9GAMM|nr:flagellar motor switch protein FliN [Buchnera aphidicola]QCI26621.1 flagellar motor switch protein FliN [Buchnera aphidicola (Thelaxes californica)]
MQDFNNTNEEKKNVQNNKISKNLTPESFDSLHNQLNLEKNKNGDKLNDSDITNNNRIYIDNIPLKITIELGTLKMQIKDLLHLKKNSVLTLEQEIGSPLNILINNHVIAQGEIVVIDNKYGIRIINIMHSI